MTHGLVKFLSLKMLHNVCLFFKKLLGGKGTLSVVLLRLKTYFQHSLLPKINHVGIQEGLKKLLSKKSHFGYF